jgi:hypothetical protein
MREMTARNLKPGMTVRAQGIDTEGTRLDLFRTVATNRHFAYSDNIIEFTDGTRVRVGKDRDFQIAVINTPAAQVTALDVIAAMFRAYAAA